MHNSSGSLLETIGSLKTSTILKAYWIILLCVTTTINSISDTGWIQAYLEIDWGLLGLEAIGIVFIVVMVVFLYRISPGIMGFGLVRLVNRLVGNKPRQTKDGTPEMEGTNINFLGTNIKYVGIVVCLLLLTGIPRWALIEEQWFRLGTIGWWDGTIRSLAFGFTHMLVGVPVVGAIVISFVGLFFTQMYFAGGIALSAQAHFQYNLILISLLLLVVTIKSFSMENDTTH